MTLLAELRRRNIFGVILLYVTAGWLLLEAGALLVDFAGMPGWVYRFLFAVLIIAFPLALVLSWMYEITPEGIRREYEVERERSITRETGSKLLRLALLSVLLVLLLNLLRFALG